LLTGAALTAACATETARTFPPEALRGCWIERRADGNTSTMRWFPARADLWNGDYVIYGPAAQLSGRFTLEQQNGRWVYCGFPAPNEAEAQVACQPIGSVAMLEVKRDALVIRDTRRAQPIVFNGRRDGCD
jgi:hypothetical protein